MSVVVVGLEHHRAPLDLLEQVAVSEAATAKVLTALRDRVNIEETVLLSTCLRTEVYAVVDRFHDAVAEVQEVLGELAGVDPATLEAHLTVRFDDDVTNHLFEVASGLDSAVVGESEVLGQVRRAAERARAERASGPVLGDLFRHAVETGKRVRAETAIGRGTTSFSHAARQLAEERRPGGLAGTQVVVVGAGTMGRALVESLVGLPADRRPAEVIVVNRTPARAVEVASAAAGPVPVTTRPLAALAEALAEADVAFLATEADRALLSAEELAGPDRAARPLLAVDLGVPRNIARRGPVPDGVTVFDMDDLAASVAQAMEERRSEIDAARAIVDQEVARYRTAARARGAAPVVAALRGRLEGLRTAELARHRSDFAGLTDEDWAKVDALTRSVLAKLVHDPTVLLKETAGTPRGERLVEALRLLFDL